MSIRAVLSCNGMEGSYPCRQAAPVGEVSTAVWARRIAAKEHSWTSAVIDGVVLDFCPACTRRRELAR